MIYYFCTKRLCTHAQLHKSPYVKQFLVRLIIAITNCNFHKRLEVNSKCAAKQATVVRLLWLLSIEAANALQCVAMEQQSKQWKHRIPMQLKILAVAIPNDLAFEVGARFRYCSCFNGTYTVVLANRTFSY